MSPPVLSMLRQQRPALALCTGRMPARNSHPHWVTRRLSVRGEERWRGNWTEGGWNARESGPGRGLGCSRCCHWILSHFPSCGDQHRSPRFCTWFWAGHGVREPMLLYPKETSGRCPGPTGKAAAILIPLYCWMLGKLRVGLLMKTKAQDYSMA